MWVHVYSDLFVNIVAVKLRQGSGKDWQGMARQGSGKDRQGMARDGP